MPLTPFAADLADAAEAEAIAKVRSESAAQLRAVMAAATPPLTPRELSLGLGLQSDAAPGAVVGRFLSDNPRNRRARPDLRTRMILDELLRGRLFLAIQGASRPGGPRHVVVATEAEVPHMDATWVVLNLGGRPVPSRRPPGRTWDTGDLFDLFGEDRARRPPPPPRRLLGRPAGHVGLGLLRAFSAETRLSDAELAALVHAALDHGVRVLDLADSYAQSDEDMHDGERRTAEVVRAWAGPRDQVLLVTKVGLRRPRGRWIPDGHPDHLREAAARSARALGVEALPLLLLHTPDPKVPLEESMGALHRLVEAGIARAIGVCNVDPAGLARAASVGPLAAVQVEASLLAPAALHGEGVVEAALSLGATVMAHRPLGGWKRRGELALQPALAAVARRLGASPESVALRWLVGLHPGILPVVGATRPETAVDAARFVDVLPGALADMGGWIAPIEQRYTQIAPPDEVVLLMGPPAAGKTTRVTDLVNHGYLRLNRDELGGRLDDLVPRLVQALERGERRVVLDNTYPTAKSRAGVLAAARAAGVPARVVELKVDRRDAKINAVHRMLDRRGRLLDPAEMAKDPDPNLLPPVAIERWFQQYQPPTLGEGIDRLETADFVRRPDPRTRAGILLDLDGTVRESARGGPFPTSADDVVLLPGRTERLAPFVAAGARLGAVTNQAGVALGQIDHAAMEAALDRTATLLGLPIDQRACTHAPDAGCWCRKPQPGLLLALMRDLGLDPARTWFVGDRDTDREAAIAAGVRFFHADVFFSDEGPAVEDLL